LDCSRRNHAGACDPSLFVLHQPRWNARFHPDVGALQNISSIGTDGDGNVYSTNFFSGEVFRLEPLP
jgi:hypothetical protein